MLLIPSSLGMKSFQVVPRLLCGWIWGGLCCHRGRYNQDSSTSATLSSQVLVKVVAICLPSGIKQGALSPLQLHWGPGVVATPQGQRRSPK